MEIPIFDSLTHPTVNGQWVHGEETASIALLNSSLRENGFSGACAVGLPGVGGYDHSAFAEACRPFDLLVPVAAISPDKIKGTDFRLEFGKLVEMGFKAVKLHPRICGLDLHEDQDLIIKIFKGAAEQDLPLFFCTYSTSEMNAFPSTDPYWSLVSILKASPKTKVILLHGGVSRMMEYAELVRFNENILLDMSYTIMKYKGSSLDVDMRYLMETLDRRLCIGSDHPEFSPGELKDRVVEMTSGISEEKRGNIFYKNITSFLKLG